MERIVLQYHSESACQSSDERLFSRFKSSIKVECTFPDSIALPDHLWEGWPVLTPFRYFGMTLERFELFSLSLENEH